MKKIAIYPGSFDPFTNGHLDILKRASSLFDEVIVLVSNNDQKKCLFSLEERTQMIKETVCDLKNVKVDSHEGLIVAYAKKIGARWIIRGMRSFTDFQPEYELHYYNKELDPQIETIVMFSSNEHLILSSSAVKTLLAHGSDISKYVPINILKYLKDK